MLPPDAAFFSFPVDTPAVFLWHECCWRFEAADVAQTFTVHFQFRNSQSATVGVFRKPAGTVCATSVAGMLEAPRKHARVILTSGCVRVCRPGDIRQVFVV